MQPRLNIAAAALIVLAVAGCGAKVEAPAEIVRYPCPDRLVTFESVPRPADPAWGKDDMATITRWAVWAEAWMDERARQARAREEQVRECHERAVK